MSLLPSSMPSHQYPASLVISQSLSSHTAAALALSTAAHSPTILGGSASKRKGLGFSIDSIVGQRENNGSSSGGDRSPPSRSVSPPVDVSSSPPPLFHRHMGLDHSPPPRPSSSEHHHRLPSPSPVNLSSSRLSQDAASGGESPPTSPGIRMPPSAFPPTSLPGNMNLSYLDRLASLKALYDSTAKIGEAAAAGGGLPPGFPMPRPLGLPPGINPMMMGLPPRLPGFPMMPDGRGPMIPPQYESPLYPWFINRHRFPGGNLN